MTFKATGESWIREYTCKYMRLPNQHTRPTILTTACLVRTFTKRRRNPRMIPYPTSPSSYYDPSTCTHPRWDSGSEGGEGRRASTSGGAKRRGPRSNAITKERPGSFSSVGVLLFSSWQGLCRWVELQATAPLRAGVSPVLPARLAREGDETSRYKKRGGGIDECEGMKAGEYPRWGRILKGDGFP